MGDIGKKGSLEVCVISSEIDDYGFRPTVHQKSITEKKKEKIPLFQN